MEYRLVAFMVNEVPMEQLAEIEGNSPVSFVGKVRRDVRLILSTCERRPTGYGNIIC
jgi:hypothetical protein